MHLQQIESIHGYDKQKFKKEFLRTGVPVIIKDFIQEDSAALHTWDYDHFRQVAGDSMVSVHNEEDAHLDKVSSPPVKKMKFSAYLDLIEKEPTAMRLFLFNLLLDKPAMQKDLHVKRLADRLITWLPFLFFGGAGSSVRYHYDIDMSHVFLSQFQGVKRVWLFANDQSDLLYRLPYNFHGIVDLRNPDYEKFPGLRYLQGWSCDLHHGDTLFIPSGYWHYIQYVTDGYSVSYRALPRTMKERWLGFRNIVITRRIDNTLRILFGKKYFDWKVRAAYQRAEKAVRKLQRREAAAFGMGDLQRD